MSKTWKEVYDYEGFDVALAYKLITETRPLSATIFT